MGRLASRSAFSNPLGLISDKLDDRPRGTETGGDFGGETRGDRFFRVDAAFFGGLSYRFAGVPVTFIAEYESDQYDREVRLGTLDSPSAWNLGLAWEPWRGINLRASWLRGDTLGLTFLSGRDKVNGSEAAGKESSARGFKCAERSARRVRSKLLVRPHVVRSRAVGTLP